MIQFHAMRHGGCRVKEQVRGPLDPRIADGAPLTVVCPWVVVGVCIARLDPLMLICNDDRGLRVGQDRSRWQRLKRWPSSSTAKLMWHVFRKAFAGPTKRFASSLLAASNVEMSTFASASTAAT